MYVSRGNCRFFFFLYLWAKQIAHSLHDCCCRAAIWNRINCRFWQINQREPTIGYTVKQTMKSREKKTISPQCHTHSLRRSAKDKHDFFVSVAINRWLTLKFSDFFSFIFFFTIDFVSVFGLRDAFTFTKSYRPTGILSALCSLQCPFAIFFCVYPLLLINNLYRSNCDHESFSKCLHLRKHINYIRVLKESSRFGFCADFFSLSLFAFAFTVLPTNIFEWSKHVNHTRDQYEHISHSVDFETKHYISAIVHRCDPWVMIEVFFLPNK